MQPEIKQRIAGKAVIVHDGKVLILREASQYTDGTHSGQYDFPGGRVEPGEHIDTALIREVKEECGLDVEIGKPIFVRDWSPVVKGVRLQIFGVFFLCTVKNANVVLSSDHDAYEWINPANPESFDLISPNKEVLALL